MNEEAQIPDQPLAGSSLLVGEEPVQEAAAETQPGAPLVPLEWSKLISRAWAVYKDNLALFTTLGSLAVVMPLLNFIAHRAAGLEPTGQLTHEQIMQGAGLSLLFALLFIVPGMLIGTWVGKALLHAGLDRFAGRPTTVGESLRRAQERYWAFLLTSLLAGVFVTAGCFGFIVPGFRLAAMLSLAPALVVIERKQYLEAIEYSFGLVGKYYSQVLLLVLVGMFVVPGLTVLFMRIPAGQVVCMIIDGIIVVPLFQLILVQLYYRLREIRGQDFVSENGFSPWNWRKLPRMVRLIPLLAILFLLVGCCVIPMIMDGLAGLFQG